MMATMTVAGTDKNQLKWHQKKWQLRPVVVMVAATAAILTIITATMAAVAGSGDGGGESCDGSGEQREALFCQDDNPPPHRLDFPIDLQQHWLINQKNWRPSVHVLFNSTCTDGRRFVVFL